MGFGLVRLAGLSPLSLRVEGLDGSTTCKLIPDDVGVMRARVPVVRERLTKVRCWRRAHCVVVGPEQEQRKLLPG